MILRTTLRMVWRVRRCAMLHLRRGKLERKAVVGRLLELIVHLASNNALRVSLLQSRFLSGH